MRKEHVERNRARFMGIQSAVLVCRSCHFADSASRGPENDGNTGRECRSTGTQVFCGERLGR